MFVLGFSHDGNFTLFRVGETASDALQQFAELGKADLLENRFAEPVPLVAKKTVNDTELNEVSDQPDPEQNKDAQDVSKSILDGFIGPEIPEGVGESISRFFIDGLHSKVTMARMRVLYLMIRTFVWNSKNTSAQA